MERKKTMVKLVLLRHGQSVANQQNTYTGWTDVPLTAKGRRQAAEAGNQLAALHIPYTDVHTSILQRAIVTADIVMEEIDQLWLPLHKSWRLNERHYGALRGMNKDYSRELFGKAQVAKWRRGYTDIPPLLTKTESDRRYAQLPVSILTRGESLAMAWQRVAPYYEDQVVPHLRRGENQLIVAHGSTLRALIKYLDHISDADVDKVEVGNGVPIVYTLDDQLHVVTKKML